MLNHCVLATSDRQAKQTFTHEEVIHRVTVGAVTNTVVGCAFEERCRIVFKGYPCIVL